MLSNSYMYSMRLIISYVFITFLSVNLTLASENQQQGSDNFFQQANTFFSTYVSNGEVNYKGIKANSAKLDEIAKIASVLVIDKSDEESYKAFWINAYNITVIKSIVENYPIKSPLDKAGFFDKKKHTIAKQAITLNDIENKILRAQFNDPRFHFVLVCGAISCPPLIPRAYMPNTLNAQMDIQTKLALNGTYFIKVNDKKKRIEGSKIMSWYKDDFRMNGTTEIDFINTYRTQKVTSAYKLSYAEYNWTLNTQ